MYDLAILGGGPAGYTAAQKAAKAGLSTVLFEAEGLGGVCLREGCIPTKALLSCAKHFEATKQGKTFGYEVSGSQASFPKMMERKTRTVRRLGVGIKNSLRDAGVEIISETAVAIAPNIIEAGSVRYEAKNILLCPGSETVIPPIPGIENNPAVITSREALSLESVPQSLSIIGGGVIGMEFAALYSSLGSKVTVIEMAPEILPGFEGSDAAVLRDIYSKRGVDFLLGAKVLSVEGDTIHTAQGADVSAEKILLSVGRRARLEAVRIPGLEIARGIAVDKHMRTNIPGVYVAGDVTGISMLAHTASREAECAVNNILGVEDVMSYESIPGVVYTNPEVCSVGKKLSEAGPGAKEFSLPMAFSGRFVAENEDITGMCGIVADAQGKILGAHLVGTPCSEVVGSICVAIAAGMDINAFSKIVFPHPSVTEILKETIK